MENAPLIQNNQSINVANPNIVSNAENGQNGCCRFVSCCCRFCSCLSEIVK